MVIEIIRRLKHDCAVLQDKMRMALDDNNIGTYNNLQKALVNNVNAIKELSTDVYEKDIYDMFIDIFKKYNDGNNNRAIFKTTDSIRNIGKTSYLERMALFNGGSLIVPTFQQKHIIKTHNPTLDVISSITELRGRKLDFVYVDEGVSEEIISYVTNNACHYFIFKKLQ